MHSASANRIESKGAATLKFRLGDCKHIFENEFQITAGNVTPTIIGNDFWDAHEAACERRDRPAHVNPVVDKARGAGVGAGAGVEGLGDFLPALVRDDRDGGGVQGHGRQEESAQGRGVGGYGRVPAGGCDGGRGNHPHGEAVPRHPEVGGGSLRLACARRW